MSNIVNLPTHEQVKEIDTKVDALKTSVTSIDTTIKNEVKSGRQIFSTVGTHTFQVPNGVTQLIITAIGGGGGGAGGGGGGGGGTETHAGGGGGAGGQGAGGVSCYKRVVPVISGSQHTITIGAGGAGGSGGAKTTAYNAPGSTGGSGGAGGITSFGNIISLSGGTGGVGGNGGNMGRNSGNNGGGGGLGGTGVISANYYSSVVGQRGATGNSGVYNQVGIGGVGPESPHKTPPFYFGAGDYGSGGAGGAGGNGSNIGNVNGTDGQAGKNGVSGYMLIEW